MSFSRAIAVIGSTGQLGSEIAATAGGRGWEVFGLSHKDVEVADVESLDRALAQHRFEVVVNTAAFHDVDECDRRPDKAFSINAVGARNVAAAATRAGARTVYVSTDYVFGGRPATGPFRESSYPAPLNAYGASKLAGEHLTLAAGDDALVVRVSSLYGRTPPRGKGRNFLQAIISKAQSGDPVKVVSDVVMSPTYTRDAAHLIVDLIENKVAGVAHLSNQGECSWFELAVFALAHLGMDVEIEPVSSAQWPSLAKRPSYSAMKSERLHTLGLSARPWRSAVAEYLNLMAE